MTGEPRHPMEPTREERAEYNNLVKLKCWRAPRYYELDRKFKAWGTYKWMQEDVWGHTFTGS